MILLLNLKNYKKCKLWINETKELLETKNEDVLKRTIPSGMKNLKGIHQIAFELSLPKNNSNYALIGFKYRETEKLGESTNVSVYVNKENLLCTKETLAKPNDKVFYGISNEYAQSILENSVKFLEENNGFPVGEIIFDIGAYAECGSSKAIFKQVTIATLKLAQLDLLNMSENEIQKEIELIL